MKGRRKWDYPPEIRAGIELHRAIDSFADAHAVNRTTALLFRPAYGRYSAALMDIVHDHFLAQDLMETDADAFAKFVEEVYAQLDENRRYFPPAFLPLFEAMRRQNWLYGYASAQGLLRSLEGFAHRAAYLTEGRTAFHLLHEHQAAFQEAYESFFPELRKFAMEKFSDIH